MRKRAGLARSLSTPQIILCDEPDWVWTRSAPRSSQLLIDINAQIDCTILIVTHNINIAGRCRTTWACCSAGIW